MQLVLIAFVALITFSLVPHSDACSRAVTPGPEEKPCGYLPPNQPNRQLVYGGNKAEAGKWPWMAFFLREVLYLDGNETKLGYIKCGGAIINQEWILTAAHCTWPSENASKYCVVVGQNDVSSFHSKELRENCTPFGQRPLQVIRHPLYNKTAYGKIINNTITDTQKEIKYHDIALIKMAPISFATPDVGCIRLPTEAGNYFDQSCYVAGWGNTRTWYGSDDLMSLRSKIWSESECRTESSYGEHDFVDNFYCFGEATANACNGDSGGPLMCKNSDGQFEAVGVMSMGDFANCTTGPGGIQEGRASYFIRVPTFLQWMKETIEANTDTKSDSLPENWDSIPKGLREDME